MPLEPGLRVDLERQQERVLPEDGQFVVPIEREGRGLGEPGPGQPPTLGQRARPFGVPGQPSELGQQLERLAFALERLAFAQEWLAFAQERLAFAQEREALEERELALPEQGPPARRGFVPRELARPLVKVGAGCEPRAWHLQVELSIAEQFPVGPQERQAAQGPGRLLE